MKLKELAELIEGEPHGDKEFEFVGLASPEKPKDKSVIFLQDLRALDRLKGMHVALVVSEEVDFPNYIKVKNVRLALAKSLSYLYPERHPSGVSEKAHIEEEVHIGKDVYVGPFVYVGKGAVLEDGVKIYPFCYLVYFIYVYYALLGSLYIIPAVL